MMQEGRENTLENDLFFVCSVIEYIGRYTKNKRSAIVNSLGADGVRYVLNLADVLHCEPIEATAQKLISKHSIERGAFDNTVLPAFEAPGVFDIAKVYKRLIAAVANYRGDDIATVLMEIYNSWICAKIDDYNSSMFFESPDYIFWSYILGEPVRDSHIAV